MAILQIIETMVTLSLLFTVTGAVRRLYFHPLAHIPGPKLAALTWWYEFYFDIVQPGRYVFKIQELHKKYGPIIRITPDELHVNDVGFLDTVYAPSLSRRDKYDYQLKTLRVPGGVGSALSHDVHKIRRDSLSPFFAKRNVFTLESVITKKVEQLCQLVAYHATDKTPTNLSEAFFGLSNDVATNFLFAHQVNFLADEKKSAESRHNTYELLKGVHGNQHFPWIPDILESLPMFVSRPIMPPGLIDMLELRERVRAELISIMENKASGVPDKEPLGPGGKPSVYSGVLDSLVLPPSEKSINRLEEDGTLLVLAGTESPAKSLTVIFYHLLSNPSVLSKLRAELSGLPRNATWTKLEQLPYLSAVIEEGNRLSFGVTARLARIASEPLTYTPSRYVTTPSRTSKCFTIPPGTPISITTLSAHTAESVFPDPYTFNPDRWLGNAGRELRKFNMAFGKGGRKCLGIELARAELYLVTAALVRRFDMTLWQSDESEVAFVHDYHVALPRSGLKGVRIVAKEL